MQRSTKADLLLLASFSFQFLRALCFWFVWTQRKRNHVLKDHDWCDFLKLLLSRVQVQLLSIDSVRVTVESWSTSVPWCLSEDPLKAHRRQTKRMCSPPAQPVTWFSISCAKPSAQKFCAGRKKCHARISKPRPTSPYSLHGGDG